MRYGLPGVLSNKGAEIKYRGEHEPVSAKRGNTAVTNGFNFIEFTALKLTTGHNFKNSEEAQSHMTPISFVTCFIAPVPAPVAVNY